MSGNHKLVPNRVKLTIDALEEALRYIDLIDERDRTQNVNDGLHKAADEIFSAIEVLKALDLTPYGTMRCGENVHLRKGIEKKVSHVMTVTCDESQR